MPTDPDDVYATCTAAADLIERDGLAHHEFWTKDGEWKLHYEPGMAVCTWGAIRAVTGLIQGGQWSAWEKCPASVAVDEEVQARGLAPSVPTWSDGRSRDEVVALLRDVAAKHQPDEYRCAPGGGGGR